jgi:hypothetical protein
MKLVKHIEVSAMKRLKETALAIPSEVAGNFESAFEDFLEKKGLDFTINSDYFKAVNLLNMTIEGFGPQADFHAIVAQAVKYAEGKTSISAHIKSIDMDDDMCSLAIVLH